MGETTHGGGLRLLAGFEKLAAERLAALDTPAAGPPEPPGFAALDARLEAHFADWRRWRAALRMWLDRTAAR